MKATSKYLASIRGAAGLVAAATLTISHVHVGATAGPGRRAVQGRHVRRRAEESVEHGLAAERRHARHRARHRRLPGTLRIIRGGKLLPTPVPGVPAVRAQGQGGMQEVGVHPKFAQNHYIYLSYAKPRNGTERRAEARHRRISPLARRPASRARPR